MGRADHLVLGDWNTQCFQCGFKRKASTLVRNWQGYYVCPEHNEPRQTQDFVKGVPDNQLAPWVQPWPNVVYTYTNTVIGYGDGVTVSFQLGSGIYPVTVFSVTVAGSPASSRGAGAPLDQGVRSSCTCGSHGRDGVGGPCRTRVRLPGSSICTSSPLLLRSDAAQDRSARFGPLFR